MQPTPLFISSISRWGLQNEEANIVSGGGSQFVSNAWGANNRVYYYPITFPFPFPAKRWFVVNGGAVSGNFDAGLYTLDGTKIHSTGTTAQSGTSTVQYVSCDFIVTPGSYYIALAASTTAASYFCCGNGIGTTAFELGPLQESPGSFGLPATMTPVRLTDFKVFGVGLTATTSGF